MSYNFWEKIVRKHPEGFSALAPMEGVTDERFRQVMLKAGRPDVFWTEFTNTSSYASEKGRLNAEQRLRHTPKEQPIVAQIWGSRLEDFEYTAQNLHKLGYEAVDINMGCPDKNVVKTGGGSGLIRTPELAVEIIKAVKTGELPVSVKTRIGFTSMDEWLPWLTLILEQDVAALTVHLRTRKEMSKVPAHYEMLPEIVKLRDEIAPKTVLIVNGDIKNHEHGVEIIRNNPGVQGFMIGRGVFEDPFCFRKRGKESERRKAAEDNVTAAISSDDLCHSSPRLLPQRKNESLELLSYHLELFEGDLREAEREGRRLPFEPMKQFFKIYIRGYRGSGELRAKLMGCKDVEGAKVVLKEVE